MRVPLGCRHGGRELVGCDEAMALLRDYRRALGASAPRNLGLLLTRAIAAQVHYALTTGHDGDLRRRIEGVGLATTTCSGRSSTPIRWRPGS